MVISVIVVVPAVVGLAGFLSGPVVSFLDAGPTDAIDAAVQALFVIPGIAEVGHIGLAPFALALAPFRGFVRLLPLAVRSDAFLAEVVHLAAKRVGLALNASDG